MKREKELKIFKKPNLGVLKSMYFKSKAYVNDKMNWEDETSQLAETFWQFKDTNKVNKAFHSYGNELSIFTTPSIEMLKSLYYNNIGYVFNKHSWELDVTNLKDIFWQNDNIQSAKDSFIRFGKELKIFKKPSIEVLKSLYGKSLGYVFNKDNWDFETPYISRTFRHLNKNHRAKRAFDKIGNELKIFNAPNIENLKKLYEQTSKYLDGSQIQNEQTSSI